MSTKTLPATYDPRQVEMARYKTWMAAGYFHAAVDPSRQPFVIMLPLPNVTGELHIGHASTFSIQDVLIRWRRMQGQNALWQPGTDHAGIATQNVVEREIAKEGLTLQQLGREKFEQRGWQWKDQYGNIIVEQLKRMGFSCDWDRFAFTLDPSYSDAVREVFVRLYNHGISYRGKRMVNWCPRDGSAISDLEVEYEEVETQLWYVRYPGAEGGPGITIATQRPETIFADVAVAVHPDDDRYRRLVGTHVMVPLANRRVPVIADRRVDAEVGTGRLKLPPGHAPLDPEIGADHRLPVLVVLDPKGRLTPDTGKYAGMDRFAARTVVGEDLRALGLVERVETYRTNIGHCDRCHAVIEPYISDQWFCEMAQMAGRAAAAIRSGRVRFHHERWAKVVLHFLDNIRPWTISRQLWWGHRIPVWQCDACAARVASQSAPERCPTCGGKALTQDPDVLDTWFSSGLWPFATLGWPRETPDLRYFYPGHTMVTANEILFLWIARMIMLGLHFMNDIPFTDVYVAPTVLTLEGRRMSKSLGTGIDPLEMADGRGYGADAVRYALGSRCSQVQVDLQDARTQDPGSRIRRPTVQHTLWYVLSNTLTLLHPIMPFITEEIWQHLPHDGPSIMVSPWPQAPPGWTDPAAEQEMEVLMAVVRAVRSLRAELSIPPAQRIPLHLRASGRSKEALERARPYLAVLARVEPIRFEVLGTPRPAGSVTTVLADTEIAIPLGGLINVTTEQARLQKTLAATRTELERLQQRLESRDFTERAPAEVVSQQRQRAEELRARIRRLQELIDSLSTVE